MSYPVYFCCRVEDLARAEGLCGWDFFAPDAPFFLVPPAVAGLWEYRFFSATAPCFGGAGALGLAAKPFAGSVL
jgi:hypothetical protein